MKEEALGDHLWGWLLAVFGKKEYLSLHHFVYPLFPKNAPFKKLFPLTPIITQILLYKSASLLLALNESHKSEGLISEVNALHYF